MPGKRVQFDEETWNAVDLLARDRMMDFQELADEAFRDLLAKHHRPTTLKDALRQSLRRAPANDTKPGSSVPKSPPPKAGPARRSRGARAKGA
jgi:hypothetical protein